MPIMKCFNVSPTIKNTGPNPYYSVCRSIIKKNDWITLVHSLKLLMKMSCDYIKQLRLMKIRIVIVVPVFCQDLPKERLYLFSWVSKVGKGGHGETNNSLHIL